MLNARLDKLAQTANPPYTYAGMQDGNFFIAKTKDTLLGVVVCKGNSIDSGIAILLRKIERARQFGFTETEYSRARAEYLRQLEPVYNEQSKQENNKYVNEYVRHFFDSESTPGIENEYTFINRVAPDIPVAAINQLMGGLITDNNQVVVLFAPERESPRLLSEATTNKLLKDTKAEKLTAYVDKVSDGPLMAEASKGGKIVSEVKGDIFGTATLTLSNGVKVIVKETGFKADEIHMRGVSLGDSSLFPGSEIINMSGLDVVGVDGLGNFGTVDLEKVSAGRRTLVSHNIPLTTESASGDCSSEDFETMIQLAYLAFTASRRGNDTFVSYKSCSKAALKSQELNPDVVFNDSVQVGVRMGRPKAKCIKADMADQMDYSKVLSIYQDRFRNASDFTFISVSNVDIRKMKPVIVEYLGALPTINHQETFKSNKIEVHQDVYKNKSTKRQETLRASIFAFYSGDYRYDLRNGLLLGMISQIFGLIYIEKVCEDEGSTYGVYVSGRSQKCPKEKIFLQITFDTTPDKKEKLMKIIFDEITNIAKTGLSETDLNKVKEYILKKHTEDLKENSHWLGNIGEYLYIGVNRMNGYEKIVNSIMVSDIWKFVDDLFKQRSEVEMITISAESK